MNCLNNTQIKLSSLEGRTNEKSNHLLVAGAGDKQELKRLRHCLHGRGFICNRNGLECGYAFRLHGADRVRYQNRVVFNTLSKVERFQNDAVSRSCKRLNRIDLKTVWSENGWLAK